MSTYAFGSVAGETMFPPRAPFFSRLGGNLPVSPLPPSTTHRTRIVQ